jgi:hypothetical protein
MFGTHIVAQIGFVLLLATFALTLWKGGFAERVGGGLNLAAGLIAVVVAHVLSDDAQPVAQLVVDGILAAGFLFLALRYASLWLGMAMILQAVQFSLHAYYMVGEQKPDLTYLWINNCDSFGIILCIIGGTIVSWRRRVRAASEESAKIAAAADPA